MYHEVHVHTLQTHSVITVHTHHTCLTEQDYMYIAMGGGRVPRAQSTLFPLDTNLPGSVKSVFPAKAGHAH